MVFDKINFVISFLLISSPLDVYGQSDVNRRLESFPRTYNIEKPYEVESKNVSRVNSSEIVDDEDKPRDRRALGIILQGLAEALGYSTSPISLSTLPNPNTTIASAAAGQPPVFTFQGGSRIAPPPPAPPGGPPLSIMKPNPPTASPPKPPPTGATSTTPRQRETIRLTGVLNFGNNSDLLGHLQRYEKIFHGGASSTAAPSAPAAPAAPPPTASPNPGLGKPALLQPYFVQIPLPIAPNLPPPLPPSAPRKLKETEHVYVKQENEENYDRESKEISDEKDVQRNPSGDTYIDEPEWKKQQREQQNALNKYRHENYKDGDDSEENDEREENRYQGQEVVDDDRENSEESLKNQQAGDEDDEVEEETHGGNNDNYKDHKEQPEDDAETYEANDTLSEEEKKTSHGKYPKKNEDHRYNDDESGYESDDENANGKRKKPSYTDNPDHAAIKNNFESFHNPLDFPVGKPSPPRPLGTRLPIRVYDGAFSADGGLRNSYGDVLSHEGQVDESVADYFQMYKDPHTGLYDWRKIQSLEAGKRDNDWFQNYQGNFPGLVVDPLGRIRQGYGPFGNARYEEYNLDGVERSTQDDSGKKDNDKEENGEESETEPRQHRRRIQKIEEEERYETKNEPTLVTNTQARGPAQAGRSRAENGKQVQPRVTTYTPPETNLQSRRFSNRDEQERTAKSRSTTLRPIRRSPKGRRSEELENRLESKSTTYEPTRQRPPVRRTNEADEKTKSRPTTYGPTREPSQATRSRDQGVRTGSRSTTYRPARRRPQERKSSEQDGEAGSRLVTYHDQDEAVEATVTTYARVKMPENVRRSGKEDKENDKSEAELTTHVPRKVSLKTRKPNEDEIVGEPVRNHGYTRGPKKRRRSRRKDEEDSKSRSEAMTHVGRSLTDQERKSNNEKTKRSGKRIESIVGTRDNAKDEPKVTTDKPTRGTSQARRSKEGNDRSVKPAKLYDTTKQPKITRRSSNEGEDEENSRETLQSVKTSAKKEPIDEDESIEGSKDVGEPSASKGFNLDGYNPYLRPLQVSYEPEKLQKTAEKILSLHNFRNPMNEDDDDEVNRSNYKNDAKTDVGSAERSIDGQLTDEEAYNYRPYFKPIQLIYDPEKLQKTADKILSSQNLGESAANSDEESKEKVRNTDVGNGESDRSLENVGPDEGSSENLDNDDRSSENLNNDDRSAEKLKEDDGSSEILKNDDRPPENVEADERPSENLREADRSVENLNNDESHSENARKNDRPSEDFRENDRSPEKLYNDENNSESAQEDGPLSVNSRDEGRSSEYSGENYSSSENWREPNDEEKYRRSSNSEDRIELKVDHSPPTILKENEKAQTRRTKFDRSHGRNKDTRPQNHENSSEIYDEDVEPTNETPAVTKFHRYEPNSYYSTNGDVPPTLKTSAIPELHSELRHSDSEKYSADSEVSPTYESPYIEELQTEGLSSNHSTDKATTRSEHDNTERKRHQRPLRSKNGAENTAIPQLRRYNFRGRSRSQKEEVKKSTVTPQPYKPRQLQGSTEIGRYRVEEQRGDEVERNYDGNYGDRIEKSSYGHAAKKDEKFEDPETAHEFFDLSKNDYALEGHDSGAKTAARTSTETPASLEKELIGLLVEPRAQDPNYQRDVALTEFTNEPESDTEKVKVEEYRNKVATLKVSEKKQLSPRGPVQLIGFTRNFQ